MAGPFPAPLAIDDRHCRQRAARASPASPMAASVAKR